jgi:hypothetical protein
MVKALSLDLRSRDLAAVAAGASDRLAAARFGYGTVQRFFAHHGITCNKRPATPVSEINSTS